MFRRVRGQAVSLFCRNCGWRDGSGTHPCHACRERPGTRRLLSLCPADLAGATAKTSVFETCACDECWEVYQRLTGGKDK